MSLSHRYRALWSQTETLNEGDKVNRQPQQGELTWAVYMLMWPFSMQCANSAWVLIRTWQFKRSFYVSQIEYVFSVDHQRKAIQSYQGLPVCTLHFYLISVPRVRAHCFGSALAALVCLQQTAVLGEKAPKAHCALPTQHQTADWVTFPSGVRRDQKRS